MIIRPIDVEIIECFVGLQMSVNDIAEKFGITTGNTLYSIKKYFKKPETNVLFQSKVNFTEHEWVTLIEIQKSDKYKFLDTQTGIFYKSPREIGIDYGFSVHTVRCWVYKNKGSKKNRFIKL